MSPGTSRLLIPPESRFAPSSSERRSACSLLMCSRCAIVCCSNVASSSSRLLDDVDEASGEPLGDDALLADPLERVAQLHEVGLALQDLLLQPVRLRLERPQLLVRAPGGSRC